MKKSRVRIGLILCVLLIGSGFFLCPRMNTWMSPADIEPKVIRSTVIQTNKVKETNAALPAAMASVPASHEVLFDDERALKALQVIPAAKLKEQNYKAYVFRRYADAVSVSGQFPSQKDSERYVQNELGPKLVSYLETKRAKEKSNSQN